MRSLFAARLDCPRLCAAPPRPADHGAVAARHLHQLRSVADRANLQYHVQPLSLDKFGDPLHTFPAFTASVANVQPTSRGTLKLKSRDPARRAGDPAELSFDAGGPAASPPIRSASRGGSSRSRRSRHTSRRNICRARTCATTTRPRWIKAAGDVGTTIFHPVGTAKMGRDDDPIAVVDARLRVFGLERLACRRCLGDAVDHLRQHQFADHDDRREGRGDDLAGQCALIIFIRNTGRRIRGFARSGAERMIKGATRCLAML